MKNLFRGRGRLHPALMPRAATPGHGKWADGRPCEGPFRPQWRLQRFFAGFDDDMYPEERETARQSGRIP